MPIPRKTALTLTDIRFSGGTPFRTAREHEEALSLIRRLAVSAGVFADLPLSAATLEPLTGGRIRDVRVPNVSTLDLAKPCSLQFRNLT